MGVDVQEFPSRMSASSPPHVGLGTPGKKFHIGKFTFLLIGIQLVRRSQRENKEHKERFLFRSIAVGGG